MKKICSQCKKNLEISHFSKQSKQKSGFRPYCKECAKKYAYKKINKKDIDFKICIICENNFVSMKKGGIQKKYCSNACKCIAYHKFHPEYQNNYYAKKINENISFKLVRKLRSRIRSALKKNSKKTSTIKLLGCSIDYLKNYLESKFKEGMNWENYNYTGWHIDHIKPCASFNLINEEEQRKCFNYMNLQPLWAKDNFSKGAKI